MSCFLASAWSVVCVLCIKLLTMRFLPILALFFAVQSLWGQKMLVLEKANRARTTKMYIGESLRFRMAGKENYWYNRTITGMIPETNTILLDGFPVKLDSIATLKVQRPRVWGILGGAFFTLGASLTLATTVGKVLYEDKNVNGLKLYSIAAVSAGAGWLMLRSKNLRLGKKHRLRLIEIKFPEPLIPPPPPNIRN